VFSFGLASGCLELSRPSLYSSVWQRFPRRSTVDEKTRPNFPRDIRRTGYSPHRRRRVGHSSFLYGAKLVSKGLSAPRTCLRSPIRRSLWTPNASMATHIICIGDANLNDLGRSITYRPIWFIEALGGTPRLHNLSSNPDMNIRSPNERISDLHPINSLARHRLRVSQPKVAMSKLG
jgi:hypothetical protein